MEEQEGRKSHVKEIEKYREKNLNIAVQRS